MIAPKNDSSNGTLRVLDPDGSAVKSGATSGFYSPIKSISQLLAMLSWLLTGAQATGSGSTANGVVTGASVIAAGELHACAVVAGGAVKCWGENEYGQLGNGNMSDSATPVVDVIGISGAIALAVGAGHTCALVADGAVECWGLGVDGRLGNGSTANSATPVDVLGISGATSIAGVEHTCALVAGGAVKCWGPGSIGQLDNGNAASSATPVGVVGIAGATSIAAGANYVGGGHTCALVAGGAVKCWGGNAEGQLGDGSTADSATPVDVRGISGATSIAAWFNHTCAVLADGAIKCWGAGSRGQLGNGERIDSSTPVDVIGIRGATSLTAGFNHTCAVVAGGAVKCWGENADGQLGNGETAVRSTPVAVLGISGAASLAAGRGFTCALVAGGAVQCWGGHPLPTRRGRPAAPE